MDIDKNQTMEFFETTDLPLAASLLSFGYDCTLQSLDGRRVKFMFVNNPNLQDLVKQYWGNELMVSPKEFSNAQRELKVRIREGV